MGVTETLVVMRLKRKGRSDETPADTFVDEVEVFSSDQRYEAEAKFIQWITEADVYIDGTAHVAALIENGYCVTHDGAVQISHALSY